MMRVRSSGAAARRTGSPASSSSAMCQPLGTLSPSLPLARRTRVTVSRSAGIRRAANLPGPGWGVTSGGPSPRTMWVPKPCGL